MTSNANTTHTQRYLNLWAVVLIAWSLYRVNFTLPDWFDEFISKPIIFLIPVVWYIRRFEKTSFLKAIEFDRSKLVTDILLGLAIGFFFFSSAVVLRFLKTGTLTPNELAIFSNPSTFIYLLGVSLATAISEEILSRGFVLKRLYADSKNIFTSSFFASILFFILHIPIMFTNPRLNGGYLIFFMVIYLTLSLANSFIFLLRKNIVLPILVYTFYSLTIVLYF